VKVLIDAEDRFTVVAGRAPAVGRHYVLEEADSATSEQNRAFHALVQEYFTSGAYSWPVESLDDLRDMVKRDLGAGFERFVYWDGERLVDAKSYEEIPVEVRKDKNLRDLCRGRLKSWSDYTKSERTKTIDLLIAEMRTAGVNSRRFDEILAGMGAA
jgi:hypothetical protein